MKIRLANKDDVDSMVEFNQAMAFETEGKHLETETLRRGVEAVFADQNKGFYVVAELEGRVVGGLMITYEWSDWRNAWWWWVQSVYIRPEARGKHIYSQLYGLVKTMANEAGAYGIRLYVETENHHAQKVYEKVGMNPSNYLMYDEMIWQK